MPHAALLTARGLTRRFGALTALDGIDLDLCGGETLAVFGPNGAGKTTLLRLLARTLKPTSGTLSIDGLDPRRQDIEARGRIGFLSHNTFLYDDLSGSENLLFFGALHGVSDVRGRSERLLEEVGLSHRADDPVRTYSRGMQQRLSLARALLHDPTILLLDEPFSGLDPHAGAMLRRTLGEIRSAGRALLLTTHDIGEGLDMSDRWIFLRRGRVVASGPSAGADRVVVERAYREGEA